MECIFKYVLNTALGGALSFVRQVSLHGKLLIILSQNSTLNAVNGSMTDHNKVFQCQDCSLYLLYEEL